MEHPIITLKTKKDQSLRRFHPWVFSGAIKKVHGAPVNGGIVEVQSNHGEFLGLGHYAEGSIAVRVFSFENQPPEASFWLDKLRRAYEARKSVGLVGSKETTMFRLVHAEGDGMPGLIIDWYDGVAVMQAHSLGMHQQFPQLLEGLKDLFGDELKAVYDKSAKTLKKSGAVSEDRYLYKNGEPDLTASEYGIKFEIDWLEGQKTGFFIDQRENRRLLGQYAKGKSVLNTFCYTGGFSLFAMQAGAKTVHSLDSSARALDLVTNNIKLNGFDDSNHKNIKADAVEYLKDLDQDYDIVILDPPAFAKHMSARHQAIQGYKRINAHAIRQIKPGGMIFTFSCSQAVDKVVFNHTITAAAISAGRKVRILHQLHQPADHPVNIFHPEGEYLKGLVLLVE
jgi:23S rRNA (cytosine1962-C5)-methyltransferase